MSNINPTQDLFALDTVQDLDNETAATCSGGVGSLYGPNPDLILHTADCRFMKYSSSTL